MNQRIPSIDIAKGLAMLAIIAGHLTIAGLDPWLFSFHVPIFFVVSGFFVSRKKNVKDFVVSRFKTLVIPYFITCLVLIGLVLFREVVLHHMQYGLSPIKEWLIASLFGAGNDYFLFEHSVKGIGAIWFLWALFWASLFLRVSLELPSLGRIIFISLLFVAGYYSKYLIWLPFSIQPGCCGAFYMYMGWLGFSQREKFMAFSKESRLVIYGIAVLVWASFIKDFDVFWMVSNTFGKGFIDIFSSLCACLVVLLFAGFVSRHLKILGGYFNFLGRHSLMVVCLHALELNLVPWFRLQEVLMAYMDWIWTAMLVLVIKLALLSLIVWVCRKIPVVQSIFP